MKTLELFAGAGGAALGLEAAGCEHLACVEWDEDACATLGAAGLPAVRGDVRDLSLYEGMAPDLLWSSFPCQAWSTAGRRKGAEDERGGDMWKATVEVIDFTGPTWFVGENVPGLTYHRGDCQQGESCLGPDLCPNAYLNQVILKDLGRHFDWVSWKILDSADYGVAQRRKRIFLVAGPSRIEWPTPTHGKPDNQINLFWENPAPWVSVRTALGLDSFAQRATGWSGVRERSPDDPAPTLTAPSGGFDRLLTLDGSRNSGNNPKQERPRPITEPAPTIGGKGNQMLRSGSEPWRLDMPSPTVSAVGECKGSGEGGNPEKLQRASDALFLATGRRRLTVEECACLMDFPDGHPFQGSKQSRYRQVGNACTPIVVQRIAEQIMKAEGGLKDV